MSIRIKNLLGLPDGTTNDSVLRYDGSNWVEEILVKIGSTGNLTLGNMTQGSISFFGVSGLLSEDNDNLYWDATNKFLGVGTKTPTYRLDVEETNVAVDCMISAVHTGNRNVGFELENSHNIWRMVNGAAVGDFLFFDATNNKSPFGIQKNTPDHTCYLANSGGVGIGTNSPSVNAGLTIEGGSLCLKETSTPIADVNYGKVYTKNDNSLYFQSGDGIEHKIAFI